MSYFPAVGSIIGAEGLNFRVRNGNGWVPLAIVTRHNFQSRVCKQLFLDVRLDVVLKDVLRSLLQTASQHALFNLLERGIR